MRRIPLVGASMAALGLLLGGCVSAQEAARYADPDAGFAQVSASTASALKGKETVWVQNSEQARETAARVTSLVQGKTVGVETAVQVALINNRGLQAAYAEIGLGAADAWQQTMLENPKLSIGVFGIATPEYGLLRALEAMISTNILAMATRAKRVDIADANFRAAQMRAVEETLTLAMQTRRAWIDAVAAFERSAVLNRARAAADASSELAQKLGETGAMTKAAQAREHALYAEITGQAAQAKLEAALAKEELTRAMGLWGGDIQYRVPDALPKLPGRLATKQAIERDALQNRVDLKVARMELEALALSHGLTQATRYVTDFELLAGFEKEKETETEYELEPGPELKEETGKKTGITPQVEVEFDIPIFDTGKARLRKGELAYMQGANRLAQKAVEARSHARAAYLSYRASHEIARHYRDAVLPLRTVVEQEELLTYNGMITNTFELLAATRARLDTQIMASEAKRQFWLADANLAAAIFGGGAEGGAGGGAQMAAAPAQDAAPH
jgi:outer membrane protein TolC